MRRVLRSLFCVLMNGKHELYETRSQMRVYQQCLLCGHETRGWDLSTQMPRQGRLF